MKVIINTYDQLVSGKSMGIPPVAILREWIGHRQRYIYGVKVWHLTKKSDPSSHAFDSFCRVFRMPSVGTFHERLKAASEEAKAWASKQYGVVEWEKNRMNDWVPAPLNTKFPLRK